MAIADTEKADVWEDQR